MRPSSVVRGVVLQALEKDFKATPSGDQLPNIESSEQSTDDKEKDGGDESAYVLTDGKSGDSAVQIVTAEPGEPIAVQTTIIPSNRPVLTEKDIQIITRYYSRPPPPYIFDARSEPFYEPVYVIGPSAFRNGHGGRVLAADMVQYEIVVGSKEVPESSQKVAVCISCTFIIILVISTVALIVALTWPKEPTKYAFQSDRWP